MIRILIKLNYLFGLAFLLFLTSCGDPNPYIQALSEPVHQAGYFWYVLHAPDYDYDPGSCSQDICHGPDLEGGASQAPPCYDCHEFPHKSGWKETKHQSFVSEHTDQGCQTDDVCHSNPSERGFTRSVTCTTYCHQ